MKRCVYTGVRLNDTGYEYDYTQNLPDDIIHLVSPQIYRSSLRNSIYWFGYRFNSDISSKDRSEFIHYVKGLTDPKISELELRNLIEQPLIELHNRINLYDVDCFVYPGSGRSNLVRNMISIINEFTSRDTSRISFELVKSVPVDVDFDWDMFDSDYKYDQDTSRYRNMKNYVEHVLLPHIHNLDYFSLAESVKPKYGKYIKNFLHFSDEDFKRFSKLQCENILVIDDINASGSTLNEILRILNTINLNSNIFVYTLIGNR